MSRISFNRHCFLAAVYQHAVWLYFRFTLSLLMLKRCLLIEGST